VLPGFKTFEEYVEAIRMAHRVMGECWSDRGLLDSPEQTLEELRQQYDSQRRYHEVLQQAEYTALLMAELTGVKFRWFGELPEHLLSLIFAKAGAPFDTCRASAAILTDPTILST
jgi:hypothetical protein